MFPQIFGKYVLEREIAAGGMARVYLATLRGAVGFEKRLVVKQIRAELASDEAFVRRFVEEAKTAVELGHPNIVPVYELGVEQGVYYIAMELCEGVSLAEMLQATGPLTPEEGAYVGIEICRALDYAHRRAGIVHRDVTPRNVMIDDEGAVRLIDFGIAAPVALDGDDGKKTEIFGSPGHMPLEQIEGRPLTPATDVFAVAALLIEAWTGRPPFRRATAAECRKAMDSSPTPLGEQIEALQPLSELVERAVLPDPAARPASPEELARPLRRFVRTSDLGDVARRLGERVEETRQRVSGGEAWLPGEGLSQASELLASTPVKIETRTFAAREDLVQWTQGFGDGQPSTRKLPSEPPPADDRASEPEVGPSTTSSGRRDAGGFRVAAIAGSLLVVAVLVGAQLLSPNAPVVATSTPPSASGAPATPVSVAPPATSVPALPASSVPAPRSSAPPPPVSAKPPAEVCQLVLTSAPPGASARVAGRAYTTPASGIELPCGAHGVSFQHAALHESASATVVLQAGRASTVHVDWTTGQRNVIIR